MRSLEYIKVHKNALWESLYNMTLLMNLSWRLRASSSSLINLLCAVGFFEIVNTYFFVTSILLHFQVSSGPMFTKLSESRSRSGSNFKMNNFWTIPILCSRKLDLCVHYIDMVNVVLDIKCIRLKSACWRQLTIIKLILLFSGFKFS